MNNTHQAVIISSVLVCTLAQGIHGLQTNGTIVMGHVNLEYIHQKYITIDHLFT